MGGGEGGVGGSFGSGVAATTARTKKGAFAAKVGFRRNQGAKSYRPLDRVPCKPMIGVCDPREGMERMGLVQASS